jgi:tetratricopeptide (TPR) repeat protein
MKMLTALLAAALLIAPACAALASPALSASERALYAGDFNKARSLLNSALRGRPDPETKYRLLLQRVRVQQFARLSGLPDKTEDFTLAALVEGRRSMPGELQAQARFAQLVSTYFKRVTGAAPGNFVSLQPAFRAVANDLADPCRKADALFFSALMLQMQGQAAGSAAGLEQARAVADAAGCELELSYSLRHLAVVAEEEGNLDKAAALAQESLAIRRRTGFDVYLPFSLLHSAGIIEKRGDPDRAKEYREEALSLATRLRLPEQAKAARAALAGEE